MPTSAVHEQTSSPLPRRTTTPRHHRPSGQRSMWCGPRQRALSGTQTALKNNPRKTRVGDAATPTPRSHARSGTHAQGNRWSERRRPLQVHSTLPRSNNALAVEPAKISRDDATTCVPRRHSGNGGGMCPSSPLAPEHAMTAWCTALQLRTVSGTPAAGPVGVRTMSSRCATQGGRNYVHCPSCLSRLLCLTSGSRCKQTIVLCVRQSYRASHHASGPW